jgi:hypothetical protein
MKNPEPLPKNTICCALAAASEMKNSDSIAKTTVSLVILI